MGDISAELRGGLENLATLEGWREASEQVAELSGRSLPGGRPDTFDRYDPIQLGRQLKLVQAMQTEVKARTDLQAEIVNPDSPLDTIGSLALLYALSDRTDIEDGCVIPVGSGSGAQLAFRIFRTDVQVLERAIGVDDLLRAVDSCLEPYSEVVAIEQYAWQTSGERTGRLKRRRGPSQAATGTTTTICLVEDPAASFPLEAPTMEGRSVRFRVPYQLRHVQHVSRNFDATHEYPFPTHEGGPSDLGRYRSPESSSSRTFNDIPLPQLVTLLGQPFRLPEHLERVIIRNSSGLVLDKLGYQPLQQVPEEESSPSGDST